MIKQRFDLYLNTPLLGIIHAADLVLVEQASNLQQVGFRYRGEFLTHPNAFSIDPEQLPLKAKEFILECRGGVPAFLDDYLPDAWGRRVLVQLAKYRDRLEFNANSVIQCLELISDSRIGALNIVKQGLTPCFELGHSIDIMKQAERAAQQLDMQDFEALELNEMSLLYLANAGTGVGGARPKALLFDDKGAYLAKFNRKNQDPYNNARVELACLQMAHAAGLEVTQGRIVSGINGREVLLLDRFDISSGARQHLITINGLLKEQSSQQDFGKAFRYDDIYTLLQKHSVNIEHNLQQLLRLMIFNRAINNTDDHERNFSLIHCGDGYQLAPAYDLVPSLATGEYHAAGFNYQPNPPKPSEVAALGQVFGLSKSMVTTIADEVMHAVQQWANHALHADVSERETARVGKYLHI